VVRDEFPDDLPPPPLEEDIRDSRRGGYDDEEYVRVNASRRACPRACPRC
jgi:hypothetical protein